MLDSGRISKSKLDPSCSSCPSWLTNYGWQLSAGGYITVRLLEYNSCSGCIAMAGSWTTGADLHHVIVLRRDLNWELMATQIDLRKPLYAREPCPDDLWLRDSDIVLLPKNKLQITNEIIDKVFTRGVYSVFPASFPYQLRQLTTIP